MSISIVYPDVDISNTIPHGSFGDRLDDIVFDAAIISKISTPSSILKKGVDFNNFIFVMLGSVSGLPAAGLSVTAKTSKNGTSFSACSNAVSELGGGAYTISLSSSDLNGDFVVLYFSASGALPTIVTIPFQKIVKNKEFQYYCFVMTSSTTNLPSPGQAVLAQRSVDGGSVVSCTNTPTEIELGVYKISFSSSDLNGSNVLLKFTAPGCHATYSTVITEA